MANILTIKGDLRGLPIDVVTHQTNCKARMKRGLAKDLADQYEGMREADRNFVNSITRTQPRSALLGMVYYNNFTNAFHPDRDISIANLYAQYGWETNQNMTDLKAIRKGFAQIAEQCESRGLTLGFPERIGSGLADGNAEVINEIIEDVLKHYNITAYRVIYEADKFTID